MVMAAHWLLSSAMRTSLSFSNMRWSENCQREVHSTHQLMGFLVLFFCRALSRLVDVQVIGHNVVDDLAKSWFLILLYVCWWDETPSKKHSLNHLMHVSHGRGVNPSSQQPRRPSAKLPLCNSSRLSSSPILIPYNFCQGLTYCSQNHIWRNIENFLDQT